jgi:exocyst complex protein 7
VEKKLLRRAHNALQMVMERLEELFKRMLVENRQCFDPEHMLVSSIAINAGS